MRSYLKEKEKEIKEYHHEKINKRKTAREEKRTKITVNQSKKMAKVGSCLLIMTFNVKCKQE